MAERAHEAGTNAIDGVQGASVPARQARTSRFGLTNLYLKVGLCALLVGLVCAALLLTRPAGSAASPWLGWIAAAGFLSGVVLYAIGRIAQVIDRVCRARARPRP